MVSFLGFLLLLSLTCETNASVSISSLTFYYITRNNGWCKKKVSNSYNATMHFEKTLSLTCENFLSFSINSAHNYIHSAHVKFDVCFKRQTLVEDLIG